jgi:hypothetical protein
MFNLIRKIGAAFWTEIKEIQTAEGFLAWRHAIAGFVLTALTLIVGWVRGEDPMVPFAIGLSVLASLLIILAALDSLRR